MCVCVSVPCVRVFACFTIEWLSQNTLPYTCAHLCRLCLRTISADKGTPSLPRHPKTRPKRFKRTNVTVLYNFIPSPGSIPHSYHPLRSTTRWRVTKVMVFDQLRGMLWQQWEQKGSTPIPYTTPETLHNKVSPALPGSDSLNLPSINSTDILKKQRLNPKLTCAAKGKLNFQEKGRTCLGGLGRLYRPREMKRVPNEFTKVNEQTLCVGAFFPPPLSRTQHSFRSVAPFGGGGWK